MNAKFLCAGIIGAGRVSTEHIKAYQASGVSVRAICSRTREGAWKKAEETNLNSVYTFQSVEEMFLYCPEINIVSVCSPPEFHVEHVIKTARAGKHIVIEKPVALNRRELEEMEKEIEKAGVKTLVCFVLRWNELIKNIKIYLKIYLKDIFYVEIDYWNGQSFEKRESRRQLGTVGGDMSTFLSGGCHAVDMAQFLLDDEIMEIQALSPFNQENGVQRTIVALVKFKSGIIGKISATDEVFSPYLFGINILSPKGTIRQNLLYSQNAYPHGYTEILGKPPISGKVSEHPFTEMIRDFVVSVKNDIDFKCGFKEAINTHLVCFAAEDSAKFGGVKFKK